MGPAGTGRQVVAGLLFVSATLLTSDAWFDVLLTSGAATGRPATGSLLTAVFVELPLAAYLLSSPPTA